ncbi:MAG: hybrid sensor histidine kinase/response regulator [Deltaproteobacteria bacterium]|nr:hybrid sensor histidine kinase/response regulator [Deltaproteobacteria bacterium]
MENRKKSVIWLSLSKAKHPSHEEAFKKEKFTLIRPSPAKPKTLQDCLFENIENSTYALFIDASVQWDELVRALRTHKDIAVRSLPTILVCDNANKTIWLKAAGVGVDDLISFEEVGRFLPKLQLMRARSQKMLRVESELMQLSVHCAKMETAVKQREEFLGVCSHDLRSPLGLIQSLLTMVLQTTPPLPAKAVDFLERARRQAAQALTLVRDLLDVMAFEQGLKPHYELFDLHQLLDEFFLDYKLQAETKGITFHYSNPIPNWRILADRERLRQLLQNLYVNAVKFTEKGKNIFLTVTPFRGRRRVDPSYPMIIISLKDEGKGIPEKEMQKIFDRFSQIKQYSRAEGRGLGLTVAKQISNLHQGNIWVESREGQGSTFFVLFPHVISRSNSEVISDNRARILVIEPDTGKRSTFFDGMEEWGYELVYPKDPVDGVALAFHCLPSAIILTASQPQLNNSDICRILRTDPLTSRIPLILATDTSEKKETDLPVDAHLALPFSQHTFQKTLERLASSFLQPKKAA